MIEKHCFCTTANNTSIVNSFLSSGNNIVFLFFIMSLTLRRSDFIIHTLPGYKPLWFWRNLFHVYFSMKFHDVVGGRCTFVPQTSCNRHNHTSESTLIVLCSILPDHLIRPWQHSHLPRNGSGARGPLNFSTGSQFEPSNSNI